MHKFVALGIVVLSTALLAACQRETDDDPCVNVVPEIGLYPNAAGFDEQVVDSVSRSSISIGMSCNAGHGTGFYDAERHLERVSVRLLVSATDSVLFAHDAQPDAFDYGFGQTAVIDSITAPMPATLRITATNSCGHSTELLRSLMLMPD